MRNWFRAIVFLPAVASLLGFPGLARADDVQYMTFQILRDGAPFGTHRLTVSREGERLTVTNEIDAKVTLGGITLFRYRHDSREIWKDGKVVSLNAVTDDDGTLTRFDATLTTAGLLIEGSAGRFVAPSDTAPMSLWRKDVLGRQHLLDMTTGAVVSVQPTRIAATGIDAERWRLGGDLDLELVYGADGLLLATRFKARGSMFEYRPIEESASLMMRP